MKTNRPFNCYIFCSKTGLWNAQMTNFELNFQVMNLKEWLYNGLWHAVDTFPMPESLKSSLYNPLLHSTGGSSIRRAYE